MGHQTALPVRGRPGYGSKLSRSRTPVAVSPAVGARCDPKARIPQMCGRVDANRRRMRPRWRYPPGVLAALEALRSATGCACSRPGDRALNGEHPHSHWVNGGSSARRRGVLKLEQHRTLEPLARAWVLRDYGIVFRAGVPARPALSRPEHARAFSLRLQDDARMMIPLARPSPPGHRSRPDLSKQPRPRQRSTSKRCSLSGSAPQAPHSIGEAAARFKMPNHPPRNEPPAADLVRPPRLLALTVAASRAGGRGLRTNLLSVGAGPLRGSAGPVPLVHPAAAAGASSQILPGLLVGVNRGNARLIGGEGSASADVVFCELRSHAEVYRAEARRSGGKIAIASAHRWYGPVRRRLLLSGSWEGVEACRGGGALFGAEPVPVLPPHAGRDAGRAGVLHRQGSQGGCLLSCRFAGAGAAALAAFSVWGGELVAQRNRAPRHLFGSKMLGHGSTRAFVWWMSRLATLSRSNGRLRHAVRLQSRRRSRRGDRSAGARGPAVSMVGVVGCGAWHFDPPTPTGGTVRENAPQRRPRGTPSRSDEAGALGLSPAAQVGTG
ncbi:hypothetical protein FQR65_LT20861 [Abscondita terminalis]|nr:hypothetical protein FQR65_LT20861 [Abscondita terminalis]